MAPGPVQIKAIAAVSPTGAALATIQAHIGFTDDPLVAGLTAISTAHVTELRARIDALRLRFGIAVFSWTDSTLAGGVVRAVHLTELRAALADVYTSAGTPSQTYTDPIVTPGVTLIKAAHIAELRSAIIGLER